jgi:Fe-S oxidoreductase
MEAIQIQKVNSKLWNYFSNYNLSLCLTCGSCSGGCPATGMPELRGLDVRKVIRMLAFGMVEEVVASDFPWVCTGCGRCTHACPMAIDIVSLMKTMKSLRSLDDVPGVMHESVEDFFATEGNLTSPRENFLSLMEDLGRELAEAECPGFHVGSTYIYNYLIELIKSRRIKVDKSINAGKVFTWHDSCKHGRMLERVFGKGFYDEPRWIIEQCVDDFVEMHPTRANSYCCGAGGAMWSSLFEKQSAYYGRSKFESIKNSGANVVVVGCSKCHYQLMTRLPKYYTDYKYEVKYIWQLVAESLVI